MSKFKTRDGHVTVLIDGVEVEMPLPVALWLKRAFGGEDFFDQQRDLWEWMRENPLPKPPSKE